MIVLKKGCSTTGEAILATYKELSKVINAKIEGEGGPTMFKFM